jgi:hypothetical protein
VILELLAGCFCHPLPPCIIFHGFIGLRQVVFRFLISLGQLLTLMGVRRHEVGVRRTTIIVASCSLSLDASSSETSCARIDGISKVNEYTSIDQFIGRRIGWYDHDIPEIEVSIVDAMARHILKYLDDVDKDSNQLARGQPGDRRQNDRGSALHDDYG